MRTDSINLSSDYCDAAQQWLTQNDPSNLPQTKTRHRNAKTAQAAHEAIRPTDVFRRSTEIKAVLSPELFELYVLIWKRTMVSQCAAAKIHQTQIMTESGSITWLATGQVIQFEGFLKYWNNIKSAKDLPVVQTNQNLTLQQANFEKKQTKPETRFTELAIVKAMETQGIGRPSTYAATIERLKHWKYAEVIKTHLHSTALGLQVDEFLQKAFGDLIQSEFTAEMERTLDQIAEGKRHWESWLTEWHQQYWAPSLEKARPIIEQHQANQAQPTRLNFSLEKSRTCCPCCDTKMVEAPSRKVQKGFFLKCPQCHDTVLFWNERRKEWQPPHVKSIESKTQNQASNHKTEYKCPICHQPLEVHTYQRDGQSKQLLRCSDAEQRSRPNHQTAVYFQTASGWWNPDNGLLDQPAQRS